MKIDPIMANNCMPIAESGCLVFMGAWQSEGYGHFIDPDTGKNVLAHRRAYEQEVGPIPDGLVPDHICRVRPCCNTDHMELVTEQVNILRGVGPSAMAARQTHCVQGHELTDGNVYRSAADGPHRRRCRTCRTATSARQAAKRRTSMERTK